MSASMDQSPAPDLDIYRKLVNYLQSCEWLGDLSEDEQIHLSEVLQKYMVKYRPAPTPSVQGGETREAALTWTTAKPKEEGDYWRYAPGWHGVMFAQVVGEPRLKHGLYIHGEERDEYICEINDGSYWMPVEIPKPPEPHPLPVREGEK